MSLPTWDCTCEDCGREWRDAFAEEEEGAMCPFCDSEDIDAVRVVVQGDEHGGS
jgi:predicted Zn-ribbon and HTH transcriptional regulator